MAQVLTPADYLVPLRLVLGWMFFSAWLRRFISVPAKMDPNSPLYIGKKFDTFLPHAVMIKPMLQYLTTHPQLLHIFVYTFSWIEFLVGLSLICGLLTRLGALGGTLLSLGILMGAGWIGTTCLDEWQIGTVEGVASLVLLFTGGGLFSLDHLIGNRWLNSSSPGNDAGRKLIIGATVFALLITLGTYQIFFGGFSSLHNDSKSPHLDLGGTSLTAGGVLHLELYRDGGPDTYGSFVTSVKVDGLYTWTAAELAKTSPAAINNVYPLQKVKTGPEGLVVPLGARAGVSLRLPAGKAVQPGVSYHVTVYDVSGAHWDATVAAG
ncbi:TQO small subunit DoxD [Desulfotomaculum copahuensis]